MRNEAIIIEFESNIDEAFKVMSDGDIGFKARAVDRVQDEIIHRLLDREYYKHGAINSFHRTWDSLDDERKSLVCAYEQIRARFLTFTEICRTVMDIERHGDPCLVTLSGRRWQTEREELDGFYAGEIKTAGRRIVKRLRECGLRPMVFGFVRVHGIQKTDKFYWNGGIRLLVGKCKRSEIERALRALSFNDASGEITADIDAGELFHSLHKVSDFRPQLHTVTERLHCKSVSDLQGKDLQRWSVWMAQQRFDDMVICSGFHKTTREMLYRGRLEDIVNRFII